MKSVDARLARLATRLGCCPIHATPCACICRWAWTGTEAELAEVVPLSERITAYYTHIRGTGPPCPTCHEPTWCRECYEAEASRVQVPDEVLSPEEWRRYETLVQLMRPMSVPR